MTTSEKRIKLIKLISTLNPQEHYVDASYVHFLEEAQDHVIESLYYKCYEDPVWKEDYPNEAVFLKRCIDKR